MRRPGNEASLGYILANKLMAASRCMGMSRCTWRSGRTALVELYFKSDKTKWHRSSIYSPENFGNARAHGQEFNM